MDIDPHEDHDIAGAHPQRVQVMRAAWGAWFREVTCQWQSASAANTDAAGRGDLEWVLPGPPAERRAGGVRGSGSL